MGSEMCIRDSIHAVVADALVKVTSSAPNLAWGNLSTADWLAIAVCFMMWVRTDETDSVKELLAEIDAAMQQDE